MPTLPPTKPPPLSLSSPTKPSLLSSRCANPGAPNNTSHLRARASSPDTLYTLVPLGRLVPASSYDNCSYHFPAGIFSPSTPAKAAAPRKCYFVRNTGNSRVTYIPFSLASSRAKFPYLLPRGANIAPPAKMNPRVAVYLIRLLLRAGISYSHYSC